MASTLETTARAAERPERPRLTLRAIYDAHASYVVRCLRYVGVREAELDDATQETFIIAHRKLGDLRPDSAYRSWLYAIALNVARHARRSRREAAMDESMDPSDGRDLGGQAEARSELLALLGHLDDDKREVVVMIHLEQMTLKEVAAAVGAPLQTVYSRLQAGTRELEAARQKQKEAR